MIKDEEKRQVPRVKQGLRSRGPYVYEMRPVRMKCLRLTRPAYTCVCTAFGSRFKRRIPYICIYSYDNVRLSREALSVNTKREETRARVRILRARKKNEGSAWLARDLDMRWRRRVLLSDKWP